MKVNLPYKSTGIKIVNAYIGKLMGNFNSFIFGFLSQHSVSLNVSKVSSGWKIL